MSTVIQTLGQRIRAERLRQGMTQEQLAEAAEVHPTYIGQVERGEKNMTILTLEKILIALGLCFTDIFNKIQSQTEIQNYPELCYELINGKSLDLQKRYYQILKEIDEIESR